jgi:hypothetical protein
MDFNLPLASFENQFGFFQNLLGLPKGRTLHQAIEEAPVAFCIVDCNSRWSLPPQRSSVVPEKIFSDMSYASDLGYSKAKLVRERITARAAVEWGSVIEVGFLRVGQLSGAEPSGYWKPKEHFPTLVRWSHEIRAFLLLEGVSRQLAS